MTTDTNAAPAAKENLLGICHAIGEDLGFNPLYLRVVLAAMLLWNPVVVLAAYAAMGVAVLASRLVFPNRKMPVAEPVATDVDEPVILAQAA